MRNENLWAPWRIRYIKGLVSEQAATQPKAAAPACFLCDAAMQSRDTDGFAQRLMLINDDRGLVMLNRYPYTSGHLLVAPHTHTAQLNDLTPAQRQGLIELTAVAEDLIGLTFEPQGLNVGINLGRCAGAGLPGHLHVHAVPRWNGDTNFMDVVGGVRVLAQATEESYALLRQTLQEREPH